MHSWSTQRLGAFGNEAGNRYFYFLLVAVEPDPGTVLGFALDDAEEWCVVIGREAPPRPDASNTEIVRIDTYHGRPHMDKLWLNPGHDDRKEWFDEEYSIHDAKDHLKRHWREYVRRYVVYREGGSVG